ncbi:acyl-CoA reductase [Russula earlei]|uniref:Acyl-CoA reductase n=1 Tax=Russula earlei TaxID=71964 RepID=A0ACC0TRZ8_9AGAM|nr:acyl-CoA reductase [Russula earlei]
MDLQQRIQLMVQLGQYMQSNEEEWLAIKERAALENTWFTPDFIELAVINIATAFLTKEALEAWAAQYQVPATPPVEKNVGIVMAGNIPLVGFHDFLCVFISGHQMTIKASVKDHVLIRHLVKKLYEWEITIQNSIAFAEMLKGCDAYIATGSNNSSRYFDYYFGKYPNIIRRNRTSVAVLDGTETKDELDLLADDIQLYFGLGCRNITHLYVPPHYDFIPLLEALNKYDSYFGFHKYKHNYDYQLAVLMMAQRKYMTNGSIILTENESLFSPVSQVNYTSYTNKEAITTLLAGNEDVQCIVGHGFLPFGKAQQPSLTDYADGVDTMAFLHKQ